VETCLGKDSDLDSLPFACVFGVYAECARDGAAWGLLLPDLPARGGRDVVAILLINFGLLAAREGLYWVRN
jgi:hypothetical protein